MDINKLEKLIQVLGPENVPLILTYITNKPVYGQAVSMKSIRETTKICKNMIFL
jgi:tryptophanase